MKTYRLVGTTILHNDRAEYDWSSEEWLAGHKLDANDGTGTALENKPYSDDVLVITEKCTEYIKDVHIEVVELEEND